MPQWTIPALTSPRKGKDLPVVVYAIIRAERAKPDTGYVYLMSLRSLLDDTNPGCYGFPGGSVKEEEEVAREIEEEVKEEVGLLVKPVPNARVTALWGPSNKALEGDYLPPVLRCWESPVQVPLDPWPKPREPADSGYVGPYRYWRGKPKGLAFGINDYDLTDCEKCYVFTPCEIHGVVSGANFPNGDSREVFGLHWADEEQWRRLSSGRLVRLQPVVATFVHAFDGCWFDT